MWPEDQERGWALSVCLSICLSICPSIIHPSIQSLTHLLSYNLSAYDVAQNKSDPSPALTKCLVMEGT